MSLRLVCSFILTIAIEELDAALTNLPNEIIEILEKKKWRDIAKIDFCIEQLEQLRAEVYEGKDLEEVIISIEKNVTEVASQKNASIGELLVPQFNVEKAAEELHGLTYLVELKCLADFKAKGRHYLLI